MEGDHKKEKPKIVIVGAGLAGLTCAYRLFKSGIKCKVFEASERVGGRCFSIRNYFLDNQIAEHGGELIDSEHNEIKELAKEIGLKLENLIDIDKKENKPFYFFNGQPYSYDEASKDWLSVYPRVRKDYEDVKFPTLYNKYTNRGYELDNISVRQWINQIIPEGVNSNLGRLLDVAYSAEYGAETNTQSALNIVRLLGSGEGNAFNIFGSSDRMYHIKGGNDQLPGRLYRALPKGTVKFKTQLLSISKVKYDKYKLVFQSACKVASVLADIVVLAIPFSVLKLSVNYDKAGFSELKKQAIDELAMGTNTKLNVQFTSRYWRRVNNNGTTYCNIGYQVTREGSCGQLGTKGILVNNTGGKIGASYNNQEYIKQYVETFINRLDRVIPRRNAKWNGKAILDYWAGNRWTLGSYPYYKLGQYTKFAGVEGESEGNCFFAGDQTSIYYQGYMNGAVESGERVCKEILERIR